MADAELLVIGGGPGGYAAAFYAADHGLSVTLVSDEEHLGGVCLLRGCIPSKALIHVASLIFEARRAAECGVRFAEPQIDHLALDRWKDQVVAKLCGGLADLARRRNVKLVRGRATFVDSRAVRVSESPGEATSGIPTISFEHAVIATGARPAIPANLAVSDPRIMDSTAALQLRAIPHRLLVVGGGYIGLELGMVYAALGTAVTIVELTEALLPGVDRDLVRPLKQRLDALFAAIHLESRVTALEPTADGVDVSFEGPAGPVRERFDGVLVSVGRRPNSERLGLENTRVAVNSRGFIEVDGAQRTSDPKIFAIGDVAGEPLLAHKATRQGRNAIEAILGRPSSFSVDAVPAVVFTDPEIAWVGLTEQSAKARGIAVQTQRFPWAASGRALTLGAPEGMTKALFEPGTGRVLGVGIVGPGAGEIIAEAALAMSMGATAEELARAIHPHPTISETLMESAESFLGSATHLYRPRR